MKVIHAGKSIKLFYVFAFIIVNKILSSAKTQRTFLKIKAAIVSGNNNLFSYQKPATYHLIK